ncbi:hypothetical protein Hdeb2414_s0012g00396541 [Helianthus debilis subsp. tardiflorus]
MMIELTNGAPTTQVRLFRYIMEFSSLYYGVVVTSVLVIIVNNSVINEIKLFDPDIWFFMFDDFHVLTFIRF